jgi:exopolysaccharide biosynthesis polyprenyl glycosylphosphotransferase
MTASTVENLPDPQLASPLANSFTRPNGSWRGRYSWWLSVSDAAVVTIVVFLAQTLRFGSEVKGPSLTGDSSVDYSVVSIGIVAMWLSALTIYRTRSPRLLGNGAEETRRVLTATLSIFGVLAVFSMLFRLDIARGYLAIALPLGALALIVSRLVVRRHVARSRRNGKFLHAVLAVGSPHSIRGLAASFARRPADGLKLVGACGPGLESRTSLEVSPTESVPVLPQSFDIEQAVIQSGADTVVLASGHLTSDEIRDLSWQLEKLDVDLVVAPGMVDVAAPRMSVWLVGGQSLIHVEKPQYSGAKRFDKRAFDVVFSLVVLIAAAPVMLIAALAIKLNSSGPVFYLSERIGLDGVAFRMVKFRSMVVNADKKLADIVHLNECDGVLFKIRQDPRVTSVGRFLRRYSIDELPQFFNVLRGQMSVIGPRPPLPKEAEAYDLQTRRRLLVRPGITGLWQVSGRSDLSWADSVRLDLSYVENWSMASDLVIAASTVKAIAASSGAY